MRTSRYYVRVGRPRARRARTQEELLALGKRARIQNDDGAIAGPWITTDDAEWAWSEGPCPCGGVMRWAEAGFVPWHRICDMCGSHWQLYVMELVPIERPTRTVLPLAERLPSEPHHQEVRVDDTGSPVAQLVDPELIDIYRQAAALVRPEHITDEVLSEGALYGGWARRARFY